MQCLCSVVAKSLCIFLHSASSALYRYLTFYFNIAKQERCLDQVKEKYTFQGTFVLVSEPKDGKPF